jgi:hypothetical protein
MGDKCLVLSLAINFCNRRSLEMLRVDFCPKSSGGADMEKYQRRFRTRTAFLTALWEHLERANQMSVEAGVTDRLDEILEHCDAAAAAIRRWQAAPVPPRPRDR